MAAVPGDIMTESPSLFEEQSLAFLHWFNSSSGARSSDKIQIANLTSQGAGRGVVALQDIRVDEELFAVPRDLVLDVAHSPISDLLKRHLSDESSWLPLIISIIHERLRGDDSQWQPYLNILPTKFDTLMFWTDQELDELRGSAVIDKIGKSDAEDTWKETIVPLMLSRPDLFPLQSHNEDTQVEELICLAHWAGSLIMAYAFDIDRDEDEQADVQLVSDEDGLVEAEEDEIPLKGMVPFADLLNANASLNNARLFQEDDYLIMRATKTIKAGEEIFNDYGPLPRSDLLRMYGYTTNNYAQYDVAEITYDLVEKIAYTSGNKVEKDQIEALDELGLLEDGYIISHPALGARLEEIVPGPLHMLLRAICGGLGKSKITLSASKAILSIEEAALLSAVCTKRLTEYKSTLEDDKHLLRKLEENVSEEAILPDRRLKMAIEVRMGEKEILHHLLNLLQDHISNLTNEISQTSGKRKHNKASDDDSRPSKTARKRSKT